jgi:hypothetical protein
MYELREITFGSGAEGDAAVMRCDWHLFHTAAWLDFIEQTQPVRRRIYGIYGGEELVGYLPGFELRKGPVRIFGSPFPGWTTAYLGPALTAGVETAALFPALATALRRAGFAHVELRPQSLNREGAVAAGFRVCPYETQVAEVAADPEGILATFTKEGRRNVRLARRDGLRAVTTTEASFVDRYYDQLQAVFAKHGLPPTYPRRRVEKLWELLMPTGRMICLEVRRDDRCLATGIDLVGNGWLHSFGSAASQDREDLKSYPNELRRYQGMCEAAARGIRHYDLTGVRAYKAKFGARVVDVPVLMLSNPLLRAGREVFRGLNRLGSRVRGPRGVGGVGESG